MKKQNFPFKRKSKKNKLIPASFIQNFTVIPSKDFFWMI